MTAPDAPPVEPLTLTLEEALQRLYAKGLTLIPPSDDTDSWGIGVASDSPDEEFDTWHEAVSAVEDVPVVPRDDTAELVQALDAVLDLDWQHYFISDKVEKRRDKAIRVVTVAVDALARVKGGAK